jgi:hypothetical protein
MAIMIMDIITRITNRTVWAKRLRREFLAYPRTTITMEDIIMDMAMDIIIMEDTGKFLLF